MGLENLRKTNVFERSDVTVIALPDTNFSKKKTMYYKLLSNY